MKSTLSFFYKTILNKRSIYIFSFILFFIFILITYILPAALKININTLMEMSVIMVLLILLIAIFSIILSTTIFRQGIDDGSELLIISKSISRKQIVLSKCLVLFSIFFIESIIAFIIPIFLMYSKYGTDSPWDYCAGYLLTTLIVSILFSAISIFFCIIMKKSHATLVGLGISFLLTLINSVNFMIVQGTGYYIQKNDYSIQNVTYYNQENQPVSGVILTKNGLPVQTNQKSNIIQNIQNQALKYTKTNIYTYTDPFFQFSTLFSLGNFYESKNNFTGRDINLVEPIFWTSNWSNFYLSFEEIENFELNKYFNIYMNDKQNICSYLFNNNLEISNSARSVNLALKQDNIDLGKFFLLPIIDSDYNKLNFKLKVFDLEKDVEKISNMLFSDNSSSIYNLYLKYQEYLNKTNNGNLSNYYNYNSFIYTYLNLGFSIILENALFNNKLSIEFGESPSIDIPTDKYNNWIEKFLNKNNISKNELEKYFAIKNSNELLGINFLKPSILLLILVRANLTNFQKYFLNQFDNSLVLNDNNIVDMNILNFFDIESKPYTNFLVLMNKNIANKNQELINNFLTSRNPGYISNVLNSLNFGKTNISLSAYQLVNVDTLNTFSSYKFNFYLNIYALVFGWLFASLLLLVISTIIYSKKDIK